MNSIKIGWKKQKPEEIEIETKKKVSKQRSNLKTSSNKPLPTISKNVPIQVDKFNNGYPYTPLSTRSLAGKSSNYSEEEVAVFNNNKLCSGRSAIITFIIAAVIIIVAATSVGIVFAVINSSSSSGTASNNNNNNMNSFTTITSGSQTSSISIGSQTGLSCSSYTEINDPTRSVNFLGTRSGCDNIAIFNATSDGSWIRFIGAGGTKIPTTAPGYNRCGAFISGWSNDTLPSVTNVDYNITLCFDTSGFTCLFVDYGLVRLCSGFPNNYYIYRLKPTKACSARYCTN